MLPALALPAAFLLSGAAGLIFQIAWFHRCGLVFGSSVAAVTVVLSSFMAGLAIGNALAGRFGPRVVLAVRAYAWLEGVVAVAGVLVTYLLPSVSLVLVPLARDTGDGGLSVNVIRFVLAFGLLAVPATAMGATLPMLMAASCRQGDRFGRALGRLYGWNTIGAVIGVLVSDGVLIARVGVAGSAWVAALLNVCAAAIALSSGAGLLSPAAAVNADSAPADAALGDSATTPKSADPLIVVGAGTPATPRAARARSTPPDQVRSTPATSGVSDSTPGRELAGERERWPLYGATALSGAILLALEVIWFRFLSMYVLVTTLAMSLMLAVVLAGIAVGGLLASRWLGVRDRAVNSLPVVACASGILTTLSYVAFERVTTGTQVGQWYIVLWFALVLTLPAACLSGVLFTFIGEALHRRGRSARQSAAQSAGRLAFANTAGAIVGPPLAAYFFLPRLGMELSLFTLATAYGVVAWLTSGVSATAAVRSLPASPAWRRPIVFASVALVVSLAMFPFGAMGRHYFPRASAAYAVDGSTIVATREGPSETLFVMQQRWLDKPVYSRLVTNGFSMSGTALLGQRYMRAFAYYPMLLHDGPLRRALVVCYGVGVTVGAVTHIPSVGTIDVAEISKDVVAMSDAIYPPDAHPLSDPRVRLHIEDGRFFLQTTTDRYDLITGEPPPPRTPGAVNIYTRDYFQLVHDRLAEGGIATYWVPVARPTPGTDVNTIIRAFCDAFSDCSLWNETPFDLMLMGSRGLTGPRSLEQFNAPWQTPGLESRLREVGFERPEQIGATFVGDAAYLRELTAGTPPLTDDFPERLRPVRGRASLSSPDYGVDAAVTQMYQSAVDPVRARQAFVASPLIRALWPPTLIDRTLPYFDQQAVINRVYWEGGRPVRQIEDLDALLGKTTLRTLPLWVLGSDEVKQRIGETGSDATGDVEFARGLRALSGRDYAGAVRWLDAAHARGWQWSTLRPLLAYALVKSGQSGRARSLAAGATPADADERHFWGWIAEAISRAGA